MDLFMPIERRSLSGMDSRSAKMPKKALSLTVVMPIETACWSAIGTIG